MDGSEFRLCFLYTRLILLSRCLFPLPSLAFYKPRSNLCVPSRILQMLKMCNLEHVSCPELGCGILEEAGCTLKPTKYP